MSLTFNTPVCPHCNRHVALVHNGVCTNIGCGKLLSAPVQLFAHVRRPPAPVMQSNRWDMPIQARKEVIHASAV